MNTEKGKGRRREENEEEAILSSFSRGRDPGKKSPSIFPNI